MRHAALALTLLCLASPLLPPGTAVMQALPASGPGGALPWGLDPSDVAWSDDVEASPDGLHVYVTGRALHGADSIDIQTVSYNAGTGAVEWVARYDGIVRFDSPGVGLDWGVDLAVSPDGAKLFVTGFSGTVHPKDTLVNDIVTLGYDAASGQLLWEHRYHGPRPNASWSVGQALAVSQDSQHVYVTGLTYPEGLYVNLFAFDFTTYRLNAGNGSVEWLSRYNGPGDVEDWGYALALSPDGQHVVVTGRSFGGPLQNWDYATVSYAAATGAEEWVQRYDGGARTLVAPMYVLALGDWSSSVAENPQGTLAFVTGRSLSDDTNYDYATLAYDTLTGQQRWLARYDGPGHFEDGAFAAGANGQDAFVTGWSASADPDAHWDYATVAYDALTGQQRWAQRYDASRGLLDDMGQALRVSPDGQRVYVSGWSFDAGAEYAYATLAYDAATGAQLWEARHAARAANNADIGTRFNAAGSDLDLVNLALSPDGSALYVAGTGGNVTFLAVAYDALTGAERWSQERLS
jgi:DNA-binding beta-propeller fold protein YncE